MSAIFTVSPLTVSISPLCNASLHFALHIFSSALWPLLFFEAPVLLEYLVVFLALLVYSNASEEPAKTYVAVVNNGKQMAGNGGLH